MKRSVRIWAVCFVIVFACAFLGGCGLFEGMFGGSGDGGAVIEQPGDNDPDKTGDNDDKADEGSDKPGDGGGQQTDAHEHTLEYRERVKASCTAAGFVEHWECTDCGKNFSDQDGKIEIVSVEIPTTAHALKHFMRREATCTSAGNVEYWICSVCDKSFSDKSGTTVIDDITIKAKGHAYADEWTSDDTYHWHKATCAHTNEVKDKDVHTYDSDGDCICGKDNIQCGKFTKKDFLKTEGTLVKSASGKTVYLRGTNAGGLFVTEHWMTGFTSGATSSDDYKSLTLKFIERFGAEKTKQLWKEYRENWWTDTDFENCANMGMTVIRLPFTYMNVDFDAISDYKQAGKNYDFSALDEFVGRAAEYGLYTILDLHGAYGSQNGQDHSGEIIGNKADVDFYSDDEMQRLTVKLWSELSRHYKNNPAVAGYDILNEPGEKGGSTSENHWKFYDKVYKAIRAENDKHIVMFESCWEWYNLPKPAQYGWTNCMYSFHHYVGDKITETEHVDNWTKKLSGIASQNFGLPLQMGEFTAYNSAEKWEKTLRLLSDNNWHYTSWTYKVWGNMSWGIVNLSGNKVDAAKDGYEDIISKFERLRTSNGTKYKFSNGKTLESIMQKYLTGQYQ